MKAWKENLPEDLQFRGPTTPRSGGAFLFLFTLSLSITNILFRPVAPVVCVCLHDFLASLYAHILLLPCTPQIRTYDRGVDGAGQDDRRGHRLVGRT